MWTKGIYNKTLWLWIKFVFSMRIMNLTSVGYKSEIQIDRGKKSVERKRE
jgi:hypothetical protein